ncbi:uncharacterized protein LOC120333833 [Styela clava]
MTQKVFKFNAYWIIAGFLFGILLHVGPSKEAKLQKSAIKQVLKNYEKVVDAQSSLTDASSEVLFRGKRHTADHLMNDKYSRTLKSHARKQILSTLLKLVGSTPGGPCQCESHSHLDDQTSRLKSRQDAISKRVHTEPSFDCNCDMYSLVSYLAERLSHGGEDEESTGSDPLSGYLSRLSPSVKARLVHFLNEESMRIKRNEMLRKLRRMRLHRQFLHRRRLLRNDPNAAFRGKQFLSF